MIVANVYDQFDKPGAEEKTASRPPDATEPSPAVKPSPETTANPYDQFDRHGVVSPERQRATEYLIPPFPKLGFPGVSAPTGPSVGEQLGQARERTLAKEKELGRPLTLRERLDIEPVLESPIAMGFGTHQIGSQLPAGIMRGQPWVNQTYRRAVKPSIVGQGTNPQIQAHLGQARDAISSIIANKANLRLTDDLGNTVVGELPKSLEQFGDAITQTKARIFRQYDALKEQTQQAGARILLAPVVNELQKIASSRVVMDQHPELARYAANLAQTYTNRFSYSMTEAQDLVQNLNESLKSFYKNPSYETTGRASVDAMIANKLRESLDLAITQTTGEAYQPFKNQYGALKAIEKEVNNRAQVVARQELGGGILGRLGDVVSAEHVISGLVHLNPAVFASGLAVKGWAQYVKFLRNPDRAIANIFEAMEQRPGGVPPQRPVFPSIPAAPFPQPGGNDDYGYAAIAGPLP